MLFACVLYAIGSSTMIAMTKWNKSGFFKIVHINIKNCIFFFMKRRVNLPSLWLYLSLKLILSPIFYSKTQLRFARILVSPFFSVSGFLHGSTSFYMFCPLRTFSESDSFQFFSFFFFDLVYRLLFSTGLFWNKFYYFFENHSIWMK